MENASTKRIEFANTLRGAAAFIVLISHYIVTFWYSHRVVSIFANTHRSEISGDVPFVVSFVSIPSEFVNYGSFGVAIFFLISGFVIPFSFEKKNGIQFVVNRAFRIYPTYIAGFSVTVLALFLSSWYFSNPFPYSFKEVGIHFIAGLRDILWSRHIDGIVWTLEVELKFYLFCGIFASFFRKKSLLIFLLPLALFIISLWFVFVSDYFEEVSSTAYRIAYIVASTSRFICFMFIGVVFNYLYRQRLGLLNAYLIIAMLFSFLIALWACEPFSSTLKLTRSYFLALCLFAICYRFRNKFTPNRITTFLANISYPLYVSHAMFGYVLMSIMLEIGFDAHVTILAVTTLSLIVSYVIHKYIEAPFLKISRRVYS